jgi:hypothetical protein
MSTDVVPVPEDQPVPPPETRELDTIVDKLADHRECLKMIKFWEDRAKRLAAEIDAFMGNATVGTVNGENVLSYKYIDRFRGKDFQNDYPDMYRLFTHEVAKTEFDLEWFKRARPDLYEQYRARSLRNGF